MFLINLSIVNITAGCYIHHNLCTFRFYPLSVVPSFGDCSSTNSACRRHGRPALLCPPRRGEHAQLGRLSRGALPRHWPPQDEKVPRWPPRRQRRGCRWRRRLRFFVFVVSPPWIQFRDRRPPSTPPSPQAPAQAFFARDDFFRRGTWRGEEGRCGPVGAERRREDI